MNAHDLFPETLLVECSSDHTYTTSLKVAEHFGKHHKNVLRKVEQILADLPDAEFGRLNFEVSSYQQAVGFTFRKGTTYGSKLSRKSGVTYGAKMRRKSDLNGTRAMPMYRITEEGFALLAMGFSGREALAWKVKFLTAFRAMERQLHARTERFAHALDQVRPALRPVVEGTEQGQSRSDIAAPLGKSVGAVTYHRRNARRLGLLAARGARP